MRAENVDVAEHRGAVLLPSAAPELETANDHLICVHDTDSVQRHHNVISRYLPHRRDLVVYLPPDYEQGDRQYPVLYLHDGQNLFDPETAYVRGMDWKADETADELIRAGEIQPLIIVGIFNTGVHRIEEYTPTRDRKLGGGHAGLYGRMLVEEIKPFIDERYRTLDGPENTGLGGSSLGGLATLYLGFTYPDVFGKLAVLSPSVWWDNKAILKIIAKSSNQQTEFGWKHSTVSIQGTRHHHPRLKIWISMGTEESKTGVRDTNLLHNALIRQGWREGENLHYEVIEGGKHNEAAWAERVQPVLKYLFPPTLP
ncbi:MAG TPA: alpha/beta hydrolase-fold protein [Terriglobales bacterium]|nr:alpha/beta hydrolase-fold protein [Terriglobales bacterium]